MFCATRSFRRQFLAATPSSAPGARPRTGSDFRSDLDAIAIYQSDCNTVAVCPFELQRGRRIFDRISEFVANLQQVAQSIKSSGKPRHDWFGAQARGMRLFVQKSHIIRSSTFRFSLRCQAVQCCLGCATNIRSGLPRVPGFEIVWHGCALGGQLTVVEFPARLVDGGIRSSQNAKRVAKKKQ